MLRLSNGKEHFYQWDIDVSIICDTDTITEVHFGNRPYGNSVNVSVVDGKALVPPEFLQIDKPFYAWAYIGEYAQGYTAEVRKIEVEKRNKPADYVYTPTEQIKLQDAIDMANEAKKTSDTALTAARGVERRANKGEFDGVTFVPFVSNNGIISWTNDGGLPNPTPVNIIGARGYSGVLPVVNTEYAPDIVLTASTETRIGTLMGVLSLTLGEPTAEQLGYSVEWVAVITQGETAHDVVLPEVEWVGDAPTFDANTVTECRLFYKGDVLMGVAI